jgi:ankyrin repeat protein
VLFRSPSPSPSFHPKRSTTPLHRAALKGLAGVVRLLLEKGADVNVQLTALIPFRLKLDRGTDSMLVAGTTMLLDTMTLLAFAN